MRRRKPASTQPRKRGFRSGANDARHGRSGGALDRRRAQGFGDGLYRMAPVRAASGCGQAEGSHGVHWSASVAEKPRTGLASNAKCLMPLQGINVFRGHKIHLPILQSPLAEFGGKHTQPQHHYAAPGYVMLDGWPSRRWTCLPSLSREPTLPAEFFQLTDFQRGTRKPAMLFLLLLPNSKRSPRRHSKTAKYP